MQSQSKAKVWFWPALAVALTLSISLQSIGAFQAAIPKPANVGIVDMKKAIFAIAITANSRSQAESLAEQMETERKAKAQKIDSLKQELEALVMGTDKYNQTMKSLSEALIDHQVFTQYSMLKLDEREAEMYRIGSNAVQDGAKQFAKQFGFDLVIVDDSREELRRGTPKEVAEQISRRRVLFAAEEIDITEALIDWINHKHQQAQAKP